MKANTTKISGFTLVEMIIYVTIFSMIFTMILVLFGRVQIAGNRAQIASNIKENATQVMQIVGKAIREADSIDLANSSFGTNPGNIVLTGNETLTIDTHVKGLTVGGVPVTIRKIKLTRGNDPAVDITSDHVDVTLFRLNELSGSTDPGSVQIELELSSINPGGDPDYDDSLSIRGSFTLRKEL